MLKDIIFIEAKIYIWPNNKALVKMSIFHVILESFCIHLWFMNNQVFLFTQNAKADDFFKRNISRNLCHIYCPQR